MLVLVKDGFSKISGQKEKTSITFNNHEVIFVGTRQGTRKYQVARTIKYKPTLIKSRKVSPPKNTSNKNFARFAISTIGVIVVLVVITFGAFFAFCLYSPDFNVAIIRGPSMEPAIKLGGLAFVMNDPEAVIVGDIIVFDIDSASQVIHRVASMDEGIIKTKGDNLEQEDFWEIGMGDVTGKYMFSVPYLGYVSSFLGTKLGIILGVVLPGSLICLYLFYSIIKEVKVQKERKSVFLLKYP